MHGVKGKEKESKKSISVPVTEGSHSEKPLDSLGSAPGVGAGGSVGLREPQQLRPPL